LTADPDDYRASVVAVDSIDTDALADELVAGGSTVDKPDILAVFEAMAAAVERRVANGARVNLAGLVELYPSIKGVFDSAADSFDSARHRVVVSAKAGSRVRDYVVANASVQKEAAPALAPTLVQYRDIGTQTTNDEVTPGNIGELTGSRLRYDPAAAHEGLFFVAAADGAETRVDIVQLNKPASQVFLVPALTAGEYELEVRARVGGATQLRTGTLAASLTVSTGESSSSSST